MSFLNEDDTKQYLCESCHDIAHNAMRLDCNLKYHNKQYTLYCSKCTLLFIQQYKKCPFNSHLHPIFEAALQQRNEINELDIICPYSNKEMIAKQHNNHHENKDKDNDLFLYDTDHGHIASEADHEGNNKHETDDISSSNDNDIGCEWIGKYKYLTYHIENECKFIPIQQQISRVKMQLNKLKNIEMENKVNKSYMNKWILLNVIVIVIFMGILCWLCMEINDMKQRDCGINNNKLEMDEINRYIDDKFDNLMNWKYDLYEHVNGYYYILRGDLDEFKKGIIKSINDKLKNKQFIGNDDDSKDSKYETYAVFDDILSNAKSTYDGITKRIDEIPFVQFVSDTINYKFKEKKEL
eukprot:231414_1